MRKLSIDIAPFVRIRHTPTMSEKNVLKLSPLGFKTAELSELTSRQAAADTIYCIEMCHFNSVVAKRAVAEKTMFI